MVDHHVDRLDVEAQQCVQLTSTNSSIGLIYALKKIFIMFAIYIDASNKIGLGHLSRCLKLSKEISKIKKKTIFLTQSDFSNKKINFKKKFFFKIKNYNKQKLANLLKKNDTKIIIFDIVKKNKLLDYFFFKDKNNTFFKVLIADNYKKIFRPELTFYPFIGNKKTKKNEYSGKDYCVLPKLPIKRKIKRIKNILISMGASDPKHISLLAAKKLLNLDCKLNIVLGKFSKLKKKDFKFLNARKYKFKIYENQKSLKNLMINNDILITNNGITKYEASIMKMPSIIISHDKKSNKFQEKFAKKNNAIFIGHYTSKKINDLFKIIKNLKNDKRKLNELQRKKILLDHHGAKRILSKIIYHYKKYEKN